MSLVGLLGGASVSAPDYFVALTGAQCSSGSLPSLMLYLLVGSTDISAVRRGYGGIHMKTAGSKGCSQALLLHYLYPFLLCPSVTSPLHALKRVPECMSSHVRMESIKSNQVERKQSLQEAHRSRNKGLHRGS